MTIQEIIQAIITLINMISNSILATAQAAAETTSAAFKEAASKRDQISKKFYEIRWCISINKYHDLKDQITNWQSETLKGLWKSYYASETFCRKTLGEIKRLTKLAEDQEHSRKGDPALAAAYRSKVEQLRSERSRALEVLARKEEKAKARAASAQEAAERAKALVKIEAEIQDLLASKASMFEEYFKLKADLKEADIALDEAIKAEEEAKDQLRIANRMIERLNDLKEAAEEAIEVAETASTDRDLERAIRLEDRVKNIFESDWLEEYIKIAA